MVKKKQKNGPTRGKRGVCAKAPKPAPKPRAMSPGKAQMVEFVNGLSIPKKLTTHDPRHAVKWDIAVIMAAERVRDFLRKNIRTMGTTVPPSHLLARIFAHAAEIKISARSARRYLEPSRPKVWCGRQLVNQEKERLDKALHGIRSLRSLGVERDGDGWREIARK